MNRHPYLRAYMAGIAVPTVFLLVAMTGFSVIRYIYNVPIPIERVIVFPMALVPNLWGAWNMLYVGLHSRRHLSIGFHGAVLPFVLAPVAFTVTRAVEFRALDFVILTPTFFATVFPIVIVVYYLAWKHVVGFFNEVLGIAG